jgi:hypothetical protein
LCCLVGEGAGDGGGAAGDLEPGVDVLQVFASGFLGHVEPPGDLGVGVADGDKAQQFPIAGVGFTRHLVNRVVTNPVTL